MRVAAVILAGGRGERLGGAVKSELRVGGVRLLDRVAAVLADCNPLLVAHGVTPPADLHIASGMIPVPDLVSDYAGPLAGVAGAVAWLQTQPARPELLITVAVDTPFLPPDYVACLVSTIGAALGAIAAYAALDYPTNGVWRLPALAELPAGVRLGTAPHSLKRLAAALGAVRVAWPQTPAGDPFDNINTPADLAAMQLRAGAG